MYLKAKKREKENEQMGQIENKYQDGKFKFHYIHINNYIKCKWSKHPN